MTENRCPHCQSDLSFDLKFMYRAEVDEPQYIECNQCGKEMAYKHSRDIFNCYDTECLRDRKKCSYRKFSDGHIRCENCGKLPPIERSNKKPCEHWWIFEKPSDDRYYDFIDVKCKYCEAVNTQRISDWIEKSKGSKHAEGMFEEEVLAVDITKEKDMVIDNALDFIQCHIKTVLYDLWNEFEDDKRESDIATLASNLNSTLSKFRDGLEIENRKEQAE